MNFYECKVRYERQMENGMVKAVTETYLVDAHSHAEAETLFIGEMTPQIRGGFTVVGVKPAEIGELTQPPGEWLATLPKPVWD